LVETLADLIIGIAEGLLFKALNHGNTVNSEVVASQMREIIAHATQAKTEAAAFEYKVDLSTPAVLTLGDDSDGRDSEGQGAGKIDGGPQSSKRSGSSKKG